MKKFLLILASLSLAVFLAGLTCGGYAKAASGSSGIVYVLVYNWNGTPCQPGQGCSLQVERAQTGQVWTTGVGTANYCGGNFPYFHFQYGRRNCLTQGFWWNSYKTLTATTPGVNEYFNIWVRQACPGGGYRFSLARGITIAYNLNLDTYGGYLQPYGSCRAGAPTA